VALHDVPLGLGLMSFARIRLIQVLDAGCALVYAKNMYCPRCATQNDDAVKYCRACGENLSVISLVMAKRLPARLITKLDAYLEWKNERLRRDSILSAFSGAIFLFLSIYHLTGEGISFTVIFTFICACILFFWSIWYYLVYQRSISVNKKTIETPPASGHKEISPRNILNLNSPPASITESTTKHLDTTRSDKKI
jgi:hypothetical protein